MSIFKWSDDYSVGVAEIDVQHKKLVELVNRLYEAMSKGQGDAVLAQTMNEIAAYTQAHFKHEEKLMDQTGYPGTAAHKMEHAKLIETVSELQKKIAAKRVMISLEVGNFLKSWLIDHIMGSDKKYSAHMVSHGVR